MRIALGILGFFLLIRAAWAKNFRLGVYDVDDDSDRTLQNVDRIDWSPRGSGLPGNHSAFRTVVYSEAE